MIKAKRDIEKLCERTGLTIVNRASAKGSHTKYLLQAPDGRKQLFVMSDNTGDPRAARNRLATLQRFSKGTTNHEST